MARGQERKLRIGVVGGRFGRSFYFHEHPNAVVEAVADLRADRRAELQRTYRCEKAYASLTELLRDARVEAVGLFTPAPDHLRHAREALAAGKHVLCAVPAAMTLEECGQLVDAVKRSGLTYMMAETSYYQQLTISARKFQQAGAFGRIYACESEYHHAGLETLFVENGQRTSRYGFPPMHYPTHCTAHLLSVTGERITEVSCLGWGDGDPVLKDNAYGNPFWNETALFRTNRGTAFRRGGVVEGAASGHGAGAVFRRPDEFLLRPSERAGSRRGALECGEGEGQRRVRAATRRAGEVRAGAVVGDGDAAGAVAARQRA